MVCCVIWQKSEITIHVTKQKAFHYGLHFPVEKLHLKLDHFVMEGMYVVTTIIPAVIAVVESSKKLPDQFCIPNRNTKEKVVLKKS